MAGLPTGTPYTAARFALTFHPDASMTSNVLLLLVASGLLLAGLKWRRCSRALLALALAWLIAVGCGPVPGALLAHLQAGYGGATPASWGQRNVIVLLGAGTVRTAASTLEASLFAYGRISKTAALYRACKQSGQLCKVEVSGGDAAGLGKSEASVYADDLRALGVDPADLLLEGRSMNTWQNAQFSVPLLQAQRADRVWLVSSGFHLRRGMLYFAHFGIDATPVRADYVNAIGSWLPSSYNFTVADLALHEYVGVARYQVYSVMGWNVKATRAGAL